MSSSFIATDRLTSLTRVLPYWLPLLVAPLAWAGVMLDGVWVLLPILGTWVLFSLLDSAVGLDVENADPGTDLSKIQAYRWVTLLWPPVQALTIFGIIAWLPHADHLNGWEIAASPLGWAS